MDVWWLVAKEKEGTCPLNSSVSSSMMGQLLLVLLDLEIENSDIFWITQDCFDAPEVSEACNNHWRTLSV